ncbi:Fibronectin type III domain protein [compost metagenome]
MKKQIFTLFQTCFLLLAIGWSQTGFSQQVLINAHNTDFTTSLNGWNGTLPNGFTYSGPNYQGTSANTTGGTYAISNAGFGYQPSSSANSCSITGTFRNTTGSTITSVEISYQAFQIVNRPSRTPNWTVTSSLGSVTGLNWIFNSSTSPASPANLTVTLTGLNVPNNTNFTITFASNRGDGSNSSSMIGLKNVKVKSIATVCAIPTNLAENNVTATSSDFNWDADGSNNFEYSLTNSATNPTGAGNTINGTSHTISTLTPSTLYYFHLRQNCGNGSFSNWVHVNFTTPAALCPAPTGLTATAITHEAAVLSWNPQGSNGFEYVVDENTMAPPGSAGTQTTDTSYNASGLTPNTLYYLHVHTNCGGGNFSPWVTIPFTTSVEPCDAPTGLIATGTTHNTAVLSWDVQGSDSFEYTVDENATAPTAAGTPTTDTNYNASALTPLTTYYLHVRTDCGAGNYSPWVTISFTTLVEPCDAPTGLVTTGITHEAAVLSWNVQGGDSFEYAVNGNTTAPTAAGTSTTDTSYNATALTPNTTYYLHVRTDCGNGNFSPWETISFTTLVEPCDAPTGLVATGTTHETAVLSWNPQGSNTFEYLVNEDATTPIVLGTPISDTSYNAINLDPSTTYYLHVRTDCSGGNFSPWVSIPFTTEVEPCDAPTGLVATGITHEAAVLSWNPQAGATFEYTVDENTTAPTAAGTPTTDTSYNATALDASTTYYLHVRTDCGNGNFSPWETISFTTNVEPCAAPTGLEDANTTHNSSDLSWDVQGGNSFEYVVNTTATAPTAAGTATTANSYSATGLTAATTYYLHVRTDCGNGNFSPWETISFTTSATPCPAPTGISVANLTLTAADLSWNTQSGNSFEYVLNTTATAPTTAGTSTPNNAYAATSLTASTGYYFHVRTNCGNGNFSPWTTFPFTTSTVGIEEQAVINLNAYPNPANGLVTISGQTEGTVTLNNTNGQALVTIDLEETSTLDITNFESGMYFLVYTNGTQRALIKLIKE